MHALTLQLASALRELLAPSHVIADTSGNSRTLKMAEADGRAALAAFDARLAQAPGPIAGEHTAEPWNADPNDHAYIRDASGNGLLHAFSESSGVAEIDGPANARRIVACVNACAGIPTELLESLELGELDAAVNDGARDPSHPMLGR